MDIGYLNYESDFASVLEGISGYQRTIPVASGNKLHRYCLANVLVDKDLKICEQDKTRTDHIFSYSQYIESLHTALRAISENARDPLRGHLYGTVATVSSGYDAPACAALALECLSCDTAATFNAPDRYVLDKGTHLARMLGYRNIVEKGAEEYMSRSDLSEAEYLASGEVGPGIAWSAFDSDFEGNLVITGLRGDRFWDKNASDVNDEFRFSGGGYASIAHIESRLRLGYIRLPIATYAGNRWTLVNAISNSPEMEPWSVGGAYDRPIPRRILEERGIPRNAFGMKKRGAGFSYSYDNMRRLKKRMALASFESFREFCHQYAPPQRMAASGTHVLRYLAASTPYYVNFILKRLGLTTRIGTSGRMVASNPFAPALLIHWGVLHTLPRYRL